MQTELFWKLGALSDAALLEGLDRVVGSGRRALAHLLAHLCEVEDRRIHLDAGYSSMFAYCVSRLGFSEDEAARRIEVARIARAAPIVFTRIAEGRLSLSAAALLRPHVHASHLTELVDVVSGKSVQTARVTLAAPFPRPDVPSSIRRLPEPKAQPVPAMPAKSSPSLPFALSPTLAANTLEPSIPATQDTPRPCNTRPVIGAQVPAQPSPRTSPPNGSNRIEALSPGRFKVQFTADEALKHQLELARDLLRHAIPSGDLGAIVQRAVDLLVADLMKRRFGTLTRKTRTAGNHAGKDTPPRSSEPLTPTLETYARPAANIHLEPPTSPPETPPARSHLPRAAVPRAVQRTVLERDGLRCTWRGADGTRCNARAWLERDHRTGHALGGDESPQNLRHLCKAHNRRAAEHVYGKNHVARLIHVKQARRNKVPPSPPT